MFAIPARPLALLLILAGCASAPVQHPHVAPSDATVVAGLEAALDGRGQHVFVENRSSEEITVTSLHLRECVNIKNRCEVTRLRLAVRPGEKRRIAMVQPKNPDDGHNFRYSWTWQASRDVAPPN